MSSLITDVPAALRCRACGTPAAPHSTGCVECGTRTPYRCDVCDKALSGLSLGLYPNAKHPHGAYSESGAPLCHEHRLTACHECGEVSRLGQMTRREVGEHVDTATREGKPPRIEPMFGYFCAECAQRAAQGPAEPRALRYWGVVMGALLAGLGVLLGYQAIFAN